MLNSATRTAALFAAALALAAGHSEAQVNPLCPLPNGTGGTSPIASTASLGAKILTVKNQGDLGCKGGSCKMDVEVQSYTNAAGAPACCTRAGYRSFVTNQHVKTAKLRWILKAQDKNSYVFNPGDGVHIVSPPPNPLDFGSPSIDSKGQWYEIPSTNGRTQSFNYAFTIFRKEADGTYLQCDPNDPIIVNQGD